jgi:diguanylate cyclase (GGDEF)-like protein
VKSAEHSLERFSLMVALIVSVLIAILLPSGYLLVSYQYLSGVLDVRSEMIADAVSGIVKANPALWRFEEHRLSEILERNSGDNVDEERRILDTNNVTIAKNYVTMQHRITRIHGIHDAGSIVANIEVSRSLLPILQVTFLLIFISSTTAVGLFYFVHNLHIKTIRKAYKSLGDSEKKYRSLYEKMNEGMALHQITLDDRGGLDSLRVVDVNPTCAVLFGSEMKTIIGSDSVRMFGDKFLDNLSIVLKKLEHELTSSFELLLPGTDKLFLVRAFSPDHGLIATFFEDITERRQSEQKIQQMAYYDALTNLPNRLLLLDRLNQAISQAARDTRKVGVLFLDLDHFKNVNDTLGHSIGDELLCTMARRLDRLTRKTDTIARLGGDEFIIVLSAVKHAEDISKVANNVLIEVSTPVTIDEIELYTSASIGISIFPEDGDNITSLLKHADLAMYKAKSIGRNNFQFFSHEMNEKATEKLMLENYLRKACEREELFLVYQPQVNLRTGKVVGVESLARWQHPVLGLVSPVKFIPIAEECGLIIPIGQWVFRNACQQALQWYNAGLPKIRVAVNVSSHQFAHHDFLEDVQATIFELGLPTDWLEIELTESAIMSDIKQTAKILSKLKEMGISISIDDFGTGYSSLSSLKHFPLDRLKIDKSFVNKVHIDTNDGAIAEAIIKISHTLGLNVIAEGVELDEQLTFLKERGCDEMQGYLYSMPLTAEAAGHFMGNVV